MPWGRLVLSLACLLAWVGNAAGDPLRSVSRLGPAPGAPDAISVALDDTHRDVLFEPARFPLPVGTVEWRPDDPWKAVVRAPLPKGRGSASHLAVSVEIRVRRRTIELPPRVVPVETAEGGPVVRVPIEHPFLASPLARSARAIRLRARPAPVQPRIAVESDPVVVPPGAWLSFGFGFLPDASASGPTRFRVRACRDDDCAVLFEEEATPGAQPGWIDRRVAVPDELGATAPEPRRLVFHFEALRPDGEPRDDHPVWSVPTLVAPAPSPAHEHHLVLISIDTLRADHLGSYGQARATSPFIDRELAARGTVFERCLSAATTTGPSHMSMLTGLAPAVHGVHTDFSRALPDGVPTLAEELRRRGFATAAFTEDGPLAAFRGFDRGFETFYEDRGDRGEHPGHVRETLDRGARWLRRNRDRRRFLFLHTYEVHTPYMPPPGFQDRSLASGPDPEPLRQLPERFRPIEYDREIRYTDSELERFFHALEADGLLEDTVVILTSDHGEEFLEHGALAHGPAVHGEVLHVPLILHGPGIARGRRISEPVSGVDLMATALDLVGVETSGGSGRSLAPFVRPASRSRPEAVPVFSEARAGVEIAFRERQIVRREIEMPVLAVQRGARKLIRHPGGGSPRYEYFHLDEDPGELEDRWDPEDPEAAALRALLERHLQESAARRREILERSARPVERPEGLDAERVEKLRALGYLE